MVMTQNAPQMRTDDMDDEMVYRGVSRTGTTRTGRTAVPLVPLSRLSEPSGQPPIYREPSTYQGRSLARRPVMPTRQRTRTSPLDRVSGMSVGGRVLVGGGILLLVCVVIMVLATIIGTGVDFMRNGVEFGFLNNGAKVVQLDAYVGHNEGNGQPSRFLAMNINRQITVMEFPGGDPNKTRVIIGPYLIGQGEEKTEVRIRTQDVNSDNKPDLVVSVKGEDFVYINDKDSFRPITAQEKAALSKGSSGAGS